jgi:hypothetical protein
VINTSSKNNIKIDGNEFAIIKKELEDNRDLWYNDYYYNLAIDRFNNAVMAWANKDYRISLDLLRDFRPVCPDDFDLTKIDLIVTILVSKAEALQVR